MDFSGESLVAVDIGAWREHGEWIHEPRLERILGVKGFRTGEPAPDNDWAPALGAIPYYRFPRWLFCPTCRQLIRWRNEYEEADIPICFRHGGHVRLVPMRFVMACPRGHLADVPWNVWAHSQTEEKCEKPELAFLTQGTTGGLESLRVYCRTCGASRSLAGIANKDRLRSLNIRCSGKQPWEPLLGQTCDAVPQVIQRSASNLTFAAQMSSIDIPPYSNYSTFADEKARIGATSEWETLKGAPRNVVLKEILIGLIAIKLQLNQELTAQLIEEMLREGDGGAGQIEPEPAEGLYDAEFRAFTSPDQESNSRDHFIHRTVKTQGYRDAVQGDGADALKQVMGKIVHLVQVLKLREVRALVGFSRLGPTEAEPEDQEQPGLFSLYGSENKIRPNLVRPDLGKIKHDRWLPAVETFGEGLFLSFKEDALEEWERQKGVRERSRILQKRQKESAKHLPTPSPRRVMLHTLAHLLIRQLSFECGYATASLRERLYVGQPEHGTPMAGILIYTAAGDAEGTMGGLVRESEPERFFPTMLLGLQKAEWCSADPLCRESAGQGLGALNLAACHACALLPETSCETGNRFLDRVMLTGTPENPRLGFFGEMIQDLILQSAEE
jgi:hypothetical protein